MPSSAGRQVEHELRKCELALLHGGFGRKPAKNHESAFDVQIETRLKYQIWQANH